MLQKHTVSQELFELLEKVMKSEVFSDFRLVGGTSLALQLGHRNSVDIDMFGPSEIQPEGFIKELEKFGETEVLTSSSNILICLVDGVKIDFVNHKYPFLTDSVCIDGIRMAAGKDIAPMKLHAIEQRGSRKDFVDLFFLLKEFSLEEMIHFFKLKYVNHIPFMMMQSIKYFRDAETQPIPKMFLDFDWNECKDRIIREHDKLKL